MMARVKSTTIHPSTFKVDTRNCLCHMIDLTEKKWRLWSCAFQRRRFQGVTEETGASYDARSSPPIDRWSVAVRCLSVV
jgi:hypothetical protein